MIRYFIFGWLRNSGHFIGSAEDAFLMRFLHDINHIAQELSNLRKDPIEVFESILKVGDCLNRTSGENFYADVQRVRIKDDIELFCFQPPCGGNIYLFDTPSERVMIDTGYGIYYPGRREYAPALRAWGFKPA